MPELSHTLITSLSIPIFQKNPTPLRNRKTKFLRRIKSNIDEEALSKTQYEFNALKFASVSSLKSNNFIQTESDNKLWDENFLTKNIKEENEKIRKKLMQYEEFRLRMYFIFNNKGNEDCIMS